MYSLFAQRTNFQLYLHNLIVKHDIRRNLSKKQAKFMIFSHLKTKKPPDFTPTAFCVIRVNLSSQVSNLFFLPHGGHQGRVP
jgi:hypothetical protein